MTADINLTINDFPMVKVYNTDFRKDLLKMYHAVCQINAWSRLDDNRTRQQLSDMQPQHSGRTFMIAINAMKQIHMHGIQWYYENGAAIYT